MRKRKITVLVGLALMSQLIVGCRQAKQGLVDDNIKFEAPVGWEYDETYSSDDIAYYTTDTDGCKSDMEITGWTYVEADGYDVVDDTAYEIGLELNRSYIEYVLDMDDKIETADSSIQTAKGFIGAISEMEVDEFKIVRTTVFEIENSKMVNITLRICDESGSEHMDTLTKVIESLDVV